MLILHIIHVCKGQVTYFLLTAIMSKVGPTFKGLWGRTETVVTGGAEHSVVVDEAYLKRSILEPSADIVKGFPPVMPVIPLKNEEIIEIIKFIEVVE